MYVHSQISELRKHKRGFVFLQTAYATREKSDDLNAKYTGQATQFDCQVRYYRTVELTVIQCHQGVELDKV